MGLQFTCVLVFYFLLNIIYIVERDACTCGSLIRVVGKVWRKMGFVCLFSPLVSAGKEEEEGTTPCCKTTSTPGHGGQSFEALETPIGKSAPRLLLVSGFSSSEKLLAL